MTACAWEDALSAKDVGTRIYEALREHHPVMPHFRVEQLRPTKIGGTQTIQTLSQYHATKTTLAQC